MIRCEKCAFHKKSCHGFISANFTEGVGNKESEVMLITDNPRTSDLINDRYFSDDNYKESFKQYFSHLDIKLQDIYISSLIKCAVVDKNKKPTKPMKTTCFDLYLKNELAEVKPKVVFLCGSMATKYLIPSMVNLKEMVGEVFYSNDYECHFVPIYDPFYLTNFSDHSSQKLNTHKAFGKAKQILEGGIGVKKAKLNYSSKYADLEKLGNIITIDLETTGLLFFHDKIITFGIADKDRQVVFDKEEIDHARIHKALKGKKIIFQNGIFDLVFLLVAGYDYVDQLFLDTRFMQYLLNPDGANSLDFMVQLYFGVGYKDTVDRENLDDASPEERKEYCAEDVYWTYKLGQLLYPKVKEQGSLNTLKIFMNLMKIVARMYYKGIYVDKIKIEELINFYTEERELYATKFKKKLNLDPEFNLNSPKQLKKLLYEDLNLPIIDKTKTATRQPSTNADTINMLAKKRPFLKGLLDYRAAKGRIEKLVGYQKAIEIDDRIHSEFNLYSPGTARILSKKPNIQNVDRKARIKEIFVPADGYTYVYYDFSQIEFRVFLHLAKDPTGIKFVNAGRDIHSFIASQFYQKPEEYFLDKKNPEAAEKRNTVKAIVFGSMYGRTPEGISIEHDVPVEQAEGIQRIFFTICNTGYQWLKKIENQVQKDKFVRTPFGSFRHFPDISMATGGKLNEFLRDAKSFIVQSWAVELVFLSMIKIMKQIKAENLDAMYVHQIYDGMIIEAKDEHVKRVADIVLEYGQNPVDNFSVPLVVELKTGKSWAEVA